METAGLKEKVQARRALPPPELRRALRRAAGVSLDDVASELGVTRQCVGNWERGIRQPSDELLPRYVAVLQALSDQGAA